MLTMTTEAIETAVSTITDGLMSQRAINIRAGWTDPPGPRRELLGVKPRISDSRAMLRARVWTASRSATFDDIRAAVALA